MGWLLRTVKNTKIRLLFPTIFGFKERPCFSEEQKCQCFLSPIYRRTRPSAPETKLGAPSRYRCALPCQKQVVLYRLQIISVLHNSTPVCVQPTSTRYINTVAARRSWRVVVALYALLLVGRGLCMWWWSADRNDRTTAVSNSRASAFLLARALARLWVRVDV